MAKCPGTIKINGFKWRILTSEAAWRRLGGDDCVGRTYNSQYTILAQPGVSDVQEEAGTVLHEVLHAVWKHAFSSSGEADQEGIVSAMELPLLSVIRDNPKLLAYLQRPEPL